MKSVYTICADCVHEAVCAFKGQFSSAKREVDNLHYGSGSCSTIRLSDDKRFSVDLRCNHYVSNISYREVLK